MKQGLRVAVGILAGMGRFAGGGSTAQAQAVTPAPRPAQKEGAVKTHASGAFEVKLTPQATEGAAVGRLSIDKQFHGDLEGTSKGEMLTGMTAVKGSAGYVAIEQVTGTLNGRTGTFLLQHTGTMARGAPSLTITIVPDSGTGQLAGIAGAMTIKVEEGKHSYELDYAIVETH
jgi:hypothetical protein